MGVRNKLPAFFIANFNSGSEQMRPPSQVGRTPLRQSNKLRLQKTLLFADSARTLFIGVLNG